MSDNLLIVISITLFAAFFFGAANVFVRAGIKQSNSNTAVFVSLLVNVVVLWLITFSVYEVKVDIYSWRYFIISGFLAPVLGRVFSFNAIDKLGMNLAVPMTYSHPQGWLVLIFVMLAGVLIRQYFVLRHSHRASPLLPVIAVLLLLSMVWWLRPAASTDAAAAQVSDAQLAEIVNRRCVACHASQPTQPGFAKAPLGLVLESQDQIKAHAERIAATVQTRYMPIGNLTGMTDAERATVASWYAGLQQ